MLARCVARACCAPRAASSTRGSGSRAEPSSWRVRALCAGVPSATDPVDFDAGAGVAAAESAAAARAASVLSWAIERGARVDKVRVDDSESAEGDGLLLNCAVDDGEIIASLPPELALTLGGGQCQAAALISGAVEDDSLWAVGLAAELMLLRARVAAVEKADAKGDELPPSEANRAAREWATYVQALPASVPTSPLFFDRKELASLQYPPVSAEVERRFEYLRGFMYETVQPLAVASGTLPPDGLRLDALGWAFSIVSSRAHRIGGTDSPGALLPVLDVANHSASPNARLAKSPASGEYQLVATAAIAAGDEVTVSYGPLGNDELVLDYGFMQAQGNAHDVVQIWLGMPLLEAGAAKARELGLTGAEALPESVDAECTREPWRRAALTRCGVQKRAAPARLGLGGVGDNKLLEAAGVVAARSEASLGDPSDAEDAAAAALVTGMAAAVESCFGTTLEEDQSVVDTLDAGVARLSPNQALAVRFRLAKKRLLRAYAAAHGAPAPEVGASKAVVMPPVQAPGEAAAPVRRRRRRATQWPKVGGGEE